MNMHKDITLDRVTEAVERAGVTLDNPGFCIRCGAEAEGVEPDAADTSANHAASPASTAPRSC